jgi:DNA-binding beta-propeller fold protein YncE
MNPLYRIGQLILVACITCTFTFARAQQTDARFTPSDAYSIETDFFKLPPGRNIGSTSGLAISPDGESIWVMDRCGPRNCLDSSLAPIMQFDADGNFINAFGAGLLVRPHGLYADKDGNVWATDDVGPGDFDTRQEGKGHQVFKFSPQGQLLMALGKPGMAGDGADEFNMPSAVIVGPNGNIYVGDGHGGRSNSRIVKFDAQGNYLTQWGERGSRPGQFDVPHALAFDSAGRLFVGDRGNNRVQIFDQQGNFIAEWPQFGRPSGMFIDANDLLYVTDSSSSPNNNPGYGEGIRIGHVSDGRIIAFIDDPDEDGTQEGVVADQAGNIYGSLTAGMALRKYALRK